MGRSAVKRVGGMSIGELSSTEAVRQAIQEYDQQGRDSFLENHSFGRSTQYYLRLHGRLYDAKAIAGVAFGYQFPERGPLAADMFSGGDAGANRALRGLEYEIIDGRPTTIHGERTWRIAINDHLTVTYTDRLIEPNMLRDFGVYGGAQGVWVDSKRTRQLDDRGIAMGVLHTGLHYPDDLTDDGLLYHYPHTKRPAGRDRAEVAATKAAGEHSIPVFVISHPTPNSDRRTVRLGWVEGWEDTSELFLITFANEAPLILLDADRSDESEFQMFGNRNRKSLRHVRERPDQARFKLQVFQRYDSRCALSGVTVPSMLEAAHIVPATKDGSNDPRNGITLNAALHRAYDANLFAINPDTYEVETRSTGPTLGDLGITTPTLAHLARRPHEEALRWRYKAWLEQAT